MNHPSAIQTNLFSSTPVQQFEAWRQTPGGKRVLQMAYALTARYARRHTRTGRTVSVKLIWELLRDNVTHIRAHARARGVTIPNVDGFALNNNFHAYLARHIESHRPDWSGLFHQRQVGKPHPKKRIIIIEKAA